MRFHKLRTVGIIAVLALLPLVGDAVDWVNNAISVTDVSQTITLPSCQKTLLIKNAGSTNPIFVCPWRNTDTVQACTDTAGQTNTGRQLDALETRTWTLGSSPNQCWKAVSIVAASTKTSTAHGDSLP